MPGEDDERSGPWEGRQTPTVWAAVLRTGRARGGRWELAGRRPAGWWRAETLDGGQRLVWWQWRLLMTMVVPEIRKLAEMVAGRQQDCWSGSRGQNEF